MDIEELLVELEAIQAEEGDLHVGIADSDNFNGIREVKSLSVKNADTRRDDEDLGPRFVEIR